MKVESNNAKQTQGSKRRRKVLLIGAGVLVLGAGAAAAISGKGDRSTEGDEDDVAGGLNLRLLPVETVAVSKESSYAVKERFVGRVESARASDLGFELSGTVKAVHVDEGETVKKGEVLAELDTARLEANRDQLAAALDEAKATEALAKSTLDRTARAAATKAVSQQRLDEAAQQSHVAEAAVRRIAAQLQAIDVDLEKSKIVAPFAGRVASRGVDEGTIISPANSIVRILETGHMEVRVGVSPRALGKVSTGDDYKLIAGDGREAVASIVRVLPQRDERVRTVDVILEIEEGKEAFRHGDLVEIPVSRRIEGEGFWVPRTALTEAARGLWATMVAVPETRQAIRI